MLFFNTMYSLKKIRKHILLLGLALILQWKMPNLFFACFHCTKYGNENFKSGYNQNKSENLFQNQTESYWLFLSNHYKKCQLFLSALNLKLI